MQKIHIDTTKGIEIYIDTQKCLPKIPNHPQNTKSFTHPLMEFGWHDLLGQWQRSTDRCY